jgi:hypothetical protein
VRSSRPTLPSVGASPLNRSSTTSPWV